MCVLFPHIFTLLKSHQPCEEFVAKEAQEPNIHYYNAISGKLFSLQIQFTTEFIIRKQ